MGRGRGWCLCNSERGGTVAGGNYGHVKYLRRESFSYLARLALDLHLPLLLLIAITISYRTRKIAVEKGRGRIAYGAQLKS